MSQGRGGLASDTLCSSSGVAKLGFYQVVADYAVHVIPVVADAGVAQPDSQRNPIAEVTPLAPADVSGEVLRPARSAPSRSAVSRTCANTRSYDGRIP